MSRFSNSIKSSANNAAKRGPITHNLDHDGDEHLYVLRGGVNKSSPAINELVADVGFSEAVRFLAGNGNAVSGYTRNAAGIR